MTSTEFHQSKGAHFIEVNGRQTAGHYGDPLGECHSIQNAAVLIDLSFRGRLCLTGLDRQRFLNGQVTNNVHALKPGEGCYAALITAKGKVVSDLNIYVLKDEILLDFEPGLTEIISRRLDKYIIADDVQIVEVAEHYGLLTIQGPAAEKAARILLPDPATQLLPSRPRHHIQVPHDEWGELSIANYARSGTFGFDVFIPVQSLVPAAEKLLDNLRLHGGGLAGWQTLEIARMEAALPRFGIDMDESNLAPEAGLDATAISYSKGCYIGQEVIARIRTYGQVAKSLRGLRLADELKSLPVRGDKLFKEGKEVGYITSANRSPALGGNIALGYVRRECNSIGTILTLRTAAEETEARIATSAFEPFAGNAARTVE